MKPITQDALTSAANTKRLQPYLTGQDRSLVFFVGAGASVAGNTGMPSTPALLHRLLLDAITFSGAFDDRQTELAPILKDAGSHVGFEITLNDFWQICHQATALLFDAFAKVEGECSTNRVHAFLAHWLSTGGIVLTTNYDRLIERRWLKTSQSSKSRYNEEGFKHWQDDLNTGGCLFKIHGSLDEPESCLGALEHVGTKLTGHRAEILEEVVRTRPLCFVGWRGIDPDIPPLLEESRRERDPSLPVFWLHYEGYPAGSVTLTTAIEGCSPLIRPYASANPILADADRAFGEMLDCVGIKSMSHPERKALFPDFTEAISHCSRSGVTRMVGISLRRVGRLDMAENVLDAAIRLAERPEEEAAAIQEKSLLQQQKSGRETDQARALLQKARKTLGNKPDLHLKISIDFGLLSMTIVNLNSRPWLLLRIPKLFRQYKNDIEILRRETGDKESVALHELLFHLYLGRLRFKTLGWLAVITPSLTDWILSPFNTAYSTIGDAKDIHVHEHIDVLAYRALALARLHQYEDGWKEVHEIDRLITILNDRARTLHWNNQRREIEKLCNR